MAITKYEDCPYRVENEKTMTCELVYALGGSDRLAKQPNPNHSCPKCFPNWKVEGVPPEITKPEDWPHELRQRIPREPVRPMRGAGDLVKAVFDFLGITKFWKGGCRCPHRQRVLNRLLPFRRQPVPDRELRR